MACSTGLGTYSAIPWFALRVKPRHEVTVAEALSGKGFPQLLPLYKSMRRWSDRVKILSLPLFPGYVFCQFRFADRLAVLQTPGVICLVTVGKAPTPVHDEEIQAIMKIMDSSLPVTPVPYIAAGDKVCIARGPFAGVQGRLEYVKNNHRLVVSVELLLRSVAVELDEEWIFPVTHAADHLPPLPARTMSLGTARHNCQAS